MGTKSILEVIKKLLGIPVDDASFDVDIMSQVNNAFSVLTDIGYAKKRWSMTTGAETWDDFYAGAQTEPDQKVIQFVYFRTRLGFDPPAQSFLLASIEKQLSELEWRLNNQ